MPDYVRLNKAPQISYDRPRCSACEREVFSDDDGWVCPNCGTYWDYSCDDGQPGELYEEWSGEELPGPTIPAAFAEFVPEVGHPGRDEMIRRCAVKEGNDER